MDGHFKAVYALKMTLIAEIEGPGKTKLALRSYSQLNFLIVEKRLGAGAAKCIYICI